MKMIRNICIIDTPFSLALYLLKMPMNEVLHTKFFTAGSIAESITERLPNKCINYQWRKVENSWKELLKIRLARFIKYPYILWSSIYAQDHLNISPQLIGKKEYTLITDAPDFFYKGMILGTQPFTPRPKGGIKARIIYYLTIHHTMYGHIYGTNIQCIQRWVIGAKEEESSFLIGRKYQLVDMKRLWNESSDEQKKFLLNIFLIDEKTLNIAKMAKVIILTQPFREDCNLTDAEYMDIYGTQVTKYTNVIVKPHPRDKFDWEKYYPDTPILRTAAPMQLLNCMGVSPKKAITVFSTAISTMPQACEKIYLGSKVNKKIFARFGDFANS